MFIEIGAEKLLRDGSIIGIFDTDAITLSERGRAFLNTAQRAGTLETLGDDLPKSVVVASDKVYLCQMNTSTLKKRAQEGLA